MFDNLPKKVTIRDMGPREGMQSEANVVPTEQKLELIRALLKAGFKHIQVTSFVSPKVVKQFADAEELLKKLEHPEGVFYWATCPNMRGLERAIDSGVNGISLPISMTDGHNIVNMQRTIAKAVKDFEQVIGKARKAGLHVHVSTSTAFGCPIEGYVNPNKVVETCKRLEWMGANGLSFGDTTGMANPRQVYYFYKMMLHEFPGMMFSTHFHDSRGMGLANVLAATAAGITIHDCALCGTGGQPSTSRDLYAFGRLGNVCTEDLVSMFEEMGVHTGIDLEKLIDAGRLFERILGRELYSFVVRSGPVKALWGGGKSYLDPFIEKFGYKDA
ncbi:MAG: hydroxymethylglutaryl-CoA lyase [Proteobacteria bacterium]|nr:hydroxymethylglutaryl-CoA lyase [Pseudomonadota bacterium]MBU2228471.1 hydroxymethylglutaryl-CoA lyase [Pseudomonadota bacterium]MBU2261396.1 hydroxymethylglutaryl-CoA lyase [Pseudomonadota bacterium]